MNDEAALRLYRPAGENGQVIAFGVRGFNLHLFEDFTQFHLRRPVDDDAQRTMLVVLADIGHGMEKIRVAQGGHGNQKLIVQITGSVHVLYTFRT